MCWNREKSFGQYVGHKESITVQLTEYLYHPRLMMIALAVLIPLCEPISIK